MGDARPTAVKGRIGIVLPPVTGDIVGPTEAEPQFRQNVPLRPQIELYTTVVVTVDVTGSRPVIGPDQMETHARQYREGTAGNEEEAAIVIAIIKTVARAPLTAKTVSHVNNRPQGNDLRPSIHAVEVAHPGANVLPVLGAAFDLFLTAVFAGDVLQLQAHGTKAQWQVASQTDIQAVVLPITPTKKALTLVVDGEPFDLDWTKDGGHTRGHLSADPELKRREAQRPLMFLIAPVIKGCRGARRFVDLQLPVDAKPVAIIGLVTRGTLKKAKIDEVGRHIATVVEELKTRKIIRQDVKVIPITIAHDATPETQARNERHGKFQEDVLRLDVDSISAHSSPGARANHWHEIPSHVAAVLGIAAKADIADFHAVMHAQQIAGSEVPIQTETGIEEGFGGAIVRGKA